MQIPQLPAWAPIATGAVGLIGAGAALGAITKGRVLDTGITQDPTNGAIQEKMKQALDGSALLTAVVASAGGALAVGIKTPAIRALGAGIAIGAVAGGGWMAMQALKYTHVTIKDGGIDSVLDDVGEAVEDAKKVIKHDVVDRTGNTVDQLHDQYTNLDKIFFPAKNPDGTYPVTPGFGGGQSRDNTWFNTEGGGAGGGF